MKAVLERVRREPALVIGAIGALISLLLAFGLELSSEQQGAITAAVVALLAFFTRQEVWPDVTVQEELAKAQAIGLAAGERSTDDGYQPRHERGAYDVGGLLVALACLVIIACGFVWLLQAL